MIRRGPGLLALALVAVAWSGPAFAAAGGASLTDTWLGIPRWVWLTVNLFVFWGLIFRFAGPSIRRYLRQRADKIQSDLAEARQQRAEVVQLRESLDAKLDEIRGEMDEMIRRGEEAAERDREEILEAAARERERLLEQTRGDIEHRVAQARQTLRRDAAELATQLAAQQLERELDEQDRRRLFDDNVRRLEREVTS